MAESAEANSKITSNKQPDDNDDDYMGDLSRFLPPSESPIIHPPTPSSSSSCSTKKHHHHPPPSSIKKKNQLKALSWQQRRKLERERKQKQEDEQTLAKVQVPIPHSNIGFKLLKQMGYTPDSSSSLGQPIGLEIRRSRAGIGLDDDAIAPHKEEEKRKRRRREKEEEEEEEALMMQEEFGSRLKSRWQSRRILVNFNKAKAVLDQLENREFVEPQKREEGEEEEEEEEEEEITQEDLHCVLMKLRDEFNYCLFCGCKYKSRDALLANCPGTDEDDN